MLYILQKLESNDLIYLIGDKEYIVGRKDCAIVIANDASISRKHAIINTKGNNITLTDCESKYGTFYNKKKMIAKVDIFLKEGDIIKFGMYGSIYRLEKMPIVTAASGLTDEQKSALKTKIASLGGHVVNNWDNSCTHLTICNIVLTVKLLHALIDGKLIVTPLYWDKFLKNIKTGKPPPNAEDFKPPIDEALLNETNISFNPARKVLFEGKIFVFSTDKVKKKMGDLISKAGGSSISWEKNQQQVSLSEITSSKNKYIFVLDEVAKIPASLARSLTNVHLHLKKLGERTIPVQEIAMALVSCSCEKDCNPKFNRVGEVFHEIQDTEADASPFALAENTPSEDGNYDLERPKREVIIPESLEAELEMFPSTSLSSNLSFPATSTQVDNFTDFAIPNPVDQNKLPPKNPESVIKSTDKNKLPPPKNVENARKPLSVTNSFTRSTPGTSKDADDEQPSKRIRLDDSVSTPMSCSSSSVETITSSNEAQSITKKRPSFENLETKKRKAEEPLNSTRKRQSRQSNIMSTFFQKPEEPENPFKALRVKRELDVEDEENPFIQMLKSARTEIAEPSDAKPVAVARSSSANDSSFEYVPSDSSDIMWISTTDIKSEVTVKMDAEMDPELRETFEKFKNVVVIETLPMTAMRIKPRFMPSQSTLDTSVGKKNFKKFKKVQPLRPQTTILVTSFRDEGNTDTKAVAIPLGSDGEDDEEEVITVRPRAVNNESTAHFVF